MLCNLNTNHMEIEIIMIQTIIAAVHDPLHLDLVLHNQIMKILHPISAITILNSKIGPLNVHPDAVIIRETKNASLNREHR